MSFIKKNLYHLPLIFIFFSADRLSKYLILNYFKSLEETNIIITSFLKFNLIWNKGIAFGFLSFNNEYFYNALTFVIIFITLILLYLMSESNRIEKLGFSLIIGGSLGNIFDRVYYASVIDFIDFHTDNFHWFIFNVADIFITIGVFILITFEVFKKDEKKY